MSLSPTLQNLYDIYTYNTKIKKEISLDLKNINNLNQNSNISISFHNRTKIDELESKYKLNENEYKLYKKYYNDTNTILSKYIIINMINNNYYNLSKLMEIESSGESYIITADNVSSDSDYELFFIVKYRGKISLSC